jgi:CubicO group peptidase (beta-lactamase class C family)
VFFDGFGGQRVYIVPSRDLVIVRIGEPSYDFDDSAIPNTIIAGLKTARPAH